MTSLDPVIWIPLPLREQVAAVEVSSVIVALGPPHVTRSASAAFTAIALAAAHAKAAAIRRHIRFMKILHRPRYLWRY
jgi:hypothetical protein